MSFSISKNIKGDNKVWGIVILLTFISILAVYSSTYNLAIREERGILYYLLRHSFYVTLGLFVMYLVHNIPMGYYKSLAIFVLIIGILLLISVFIFPDDLNRARGAARWTSLPGIGISLQSSDAAKITLMIYLAYMLDKANFSSIWDFLGKVILPTAVVLALIVVGNMSTALLIGVSVFILILVSEIKTHLKLFTIALALGGCVLIYVVGVNFPEVLPRFSTAQERTGRFNSVESSLRDKEKNFQPEQAKIAVASGGFLGKGPGNSKQQYILSEAYNDFIYAIIVEEYGIFGGGLVLILYLILFYRVILIARKCTKPFPMYVVIGLGTLIVLQALIHIGVSVGGIPVMGQTLPLVSLGGTSILFMSVAFGIILGVSRAANLQEEKLRSSEGTTEIENNEILSNENK